MRHKLTIIIFISLLFPFSFTAYGQKQINSPYSRFNLGTMEQHLVVFYGCGKMIDFIGPLNAPDVLDLGASAERRVLNIILHLLAYPPSTAHQAR